MTKYKSNNYISPSVESIEIDVESGFATSLNGVTLNGGHYESEEEW